MTIYLSGPHPLIALDIVPSPTPDDMNFIYGLVQFVGKAQDDDLASTKPDKQDWNAMITGTSTIAIDSAFLSNRFHRTAFRQVLRDGFNKYGRDDITIYDFFD